MWKEQRENVNTACRIIGVIIAGITLGITIRNLDTPPHKGSQSVKTTIKIGEINSSSILENENNL